MREAGTSITLAWLFSGGDASFVKPVLGVQQRLASCDLHA